MKDLYYIEYTDMVSENWNHWVRSDIIPSVGDLVDLPSDGRGRVLFVEYIYKKIDEISKLDQIKIFLDWNV
jgi:hypothetical protein